MYSFKNTYKPLDAVFPRHFLLFYKTKSANRYQFGFNGQLKDNEIYGEGNAYDYGDREYDPRSVRRWNTDPQSKKYPYYSPYLAFGNNPIYYVDKKGDVRIVYFKHIAQDGTETTFKLVNSKEIKWKWVYMDAMGHDREWRYRGHDIQENIVYDDRTKEFTYDVTYSPRKFAQGAREFLGQSFEGDGGSQKGGFYLYSQTGGESSTKQKSEFTPVPIDVTDFINALGGIGKATSLPKEITPFDWMTSLANFIKEVVPQIIEPSKAESKQEQSNDISKIKADDDSIWVEKKPVQKNGWYWKSNEYEKASNPKKNKENKQKEE